MNYQFGGDPKHPLDSALVNAIDCIWQDGAIAQLLEEEAGKFYLMDSAS